MKLDFLYIGPDKSGSTWIHNTLNQHPSCFVPQKVKETFYFDRYYDRGLAWYQGFFKGIPENITAVGEICHDYLFSKTAAQRIKNDFPDIKLISCLRNPVERAFSQYLFLIRSGITKEPFLQAIRNIRRLTDNSLYFKHLSCYFELFDTGQIKIMFFENLKTDPTRFARDLFNFIGVETDLDIDFNGPALPASRPRSFYMARLAKFGANTARHLGMERIVGRIKTSMLANFLYIPYDKSDKPMLNKEERKYLIKYFRDDIKKLERILNINLSHWVNFEE